MRLPNGERAEIDPRKLTDYVLNPTHARGGEHKNRIFAAKGITLANREELLAALRDAARDSTEAVLGRMDHYGQRYTLDFIFRGDVLLRSG